MTMYKPPAVFIDTALPSQVVVRSHVHATEEELAQLFEHAPNPLNCFAGQLGDDLVMVWLDREPTLWHLWANNRAASLRFWLNLHKVQ